MKLFAVVLGLVAFVSSPALAQGTICNSQAVINFPNGDNLNRVIGQSVAMSISLSNGPSLNANVSDNQTFSVVHFFPSCTSVVGNLCTVDQGENAGAPPPIAYAGNFGTSCSIVPSVDATDPFDIKFNFVPPITLANASSCLLTFNVLVTERGNLASTPTNIAQLASTDGTCDSGLTSSGTGTSQITLTCPPCDDGNPCTADACDAATALCTHSNPPNCDDNNVCTADQCISPTECSHSTPPNCDDNNVCTTDTCISPTECNHTTPPNCDDNDVCTDDVCTGPNPGDCSHPPASPQPPECIPAPGSCRMTGGHNYDVAVDAEFNENGKVYTTGGQIGAPNESGCCDFPPKGKCVEGTCTGGLNGGLACSSNDDCPNDPGRNSHCPWGDWEHNHHSGSDDSNSVTAGSFAFHSGTAAAPDAAFISSVQCADPGWCVQARPAPFKQIFWEGTGVFHNAKTDKNKPIPLPLFNGCPADQQPVPYSKDGGTLHYYKAHVSDFGEPAGIHQKPIDGCQKAETCTDREPNQSVEINNCLLGDVCLIDRETDPVKSALHPLCEAQTCSECPDEYEIEIHCTADPSSPIAYEVSHEIREGNFQLHPPVGDSCNFSCGDGVCETGVDGSQEDCAEDCL